MNGTIENAPTMTAQILKCALLGSRLGYLKIVS